MSHQSERSNYIKKIFFLFFFLGLTALSRESLARSCKPLFEKNTSAEVSFDVARKLRNEGDSLAANKILDQLSEILLTLPVQEVQPLGGGKTESFVVTLADQTKAVFKPVNPERPNQPHREAAAYRLSRLLNLDIVPPTVIRVLRGKNIPKNLAGREGSLQYFLATAKPLKKSKSRGQNILLKDNKTFKVEDHLSGQRLRVFDWLINNHDRGSNAGNYLVSQFDKHIFGIDHSTSFVGHDKEAREDKVPFYTKNFLKDEEFYLKLKSASPSQIRKALKGLNPVRIKEFLQRYENLIKDFEEVLKN